MSYRVPSIGETVVLVDSNGEIDTAFVGRVVDPNAGVVVLSQDGLGDLTVRYVDPSGANAYEGMTWHYASDDISRIGKIASDGRVTGIPGYAEYVMTPSPRRSGCASC